MRQLLPSPRRRAPSRRQGLIVLLPGLLSACLPADQITETRPLTVHAQVSTLSGEPAEGAGMLLVLTECPPMIGEAIRNLQKENLSHPWYHSAQTTTDAEGHLAWDFPGIRRMTSVPFLLYYGPLYPLDDLMLLVKTLWDGSVYKLNGRRAAQDRTLNVRRCLDRCEASTGLAARFEIGDEADIIRVEARLSSPQGSSTTEPW